MRISVLVSLPLVLGGIVSAAEPPSIAKVHITTGAKPKLTKILALGISDDRETRHRFEDKLVTHLRGRGLGAVTSYSIADDLTRPGDRDEILAALAREGVDGVLTVRAVPLDRDTEAAWPEAWAAWIDSPATVRELVERTLPLPAKPVRRYGAEITLWELGTGNRPWAARTTVCDRKELRKAASDLVQDTIAQLRELRIF
jgi:hypothetical protein